VGTFQLDISPFESLRTGKGFVMYPPRFWGVDRGVMMSMYFVFFRRVFTFLPSMGNGNGHLWVKGPVVMVTVQGVVFMILTASPGERISFLKVIRVVNVPFAIESLGNVISAISSVNVNFSAMESMIVGRGGS
jgi:hypothetical protein